MSQAESGVQVGTRFDVQSADGTSIAVWAEGAGPPLVMVHGSVFNHRLLDPLVEHLKGSLTTYRMNRRGFPPSADAEHYSIEQEFEDVAAVVEEVALRTDQPVAVFGHSYGANSAMGGATRSGTVHRLILYEPSLGFLSPPGWIEAMERELEAGRPEEVLRSLFVDVLDGTEEDVATVRDSPDWADCLHATGTTVLRECREESRWIYRPSDLDGMAASTLMLVGTESPHGLLRSSLLALAELPNAQVHVLKGHGHGAFLEDAAMVAGVIKRFIGNPDGVEPSAVAT